MALENFADEFADLVAGKVVALLAKQQGSDWPNVEIKSYDVKQHGETDKQAIERELANLESPLNDDKVVEEPEEEKVVETKVKIANDPTAKRRSELLKVNIQTLRRDIAAVEGKDKSDYGHIAKPDLVNQIVALETILGHTLQQEIDKNLTDSGLKVEPSKPEPEEDEVPDDDTVVEEPADDDGPEELTREGALSLDLATLKAIAIDNDILAEDLRGLDVEAVVALLYGAEEAAVETEEVVDDTSEAATEADPVAQDADDDEEGDSYTANDFKQMSIAELVEAADSLNSQGAEIKYDRKTSREQLLEQILELLDLNA